MKSLMSMLTERPKIYCPKHPGNEAYDSCGFCGKPICRECKGIACDDMFTFCNRDCYRYFRTDRKDMPPDAARIFDQKWNKPTRKATLGVTGCLVIVIVGIAVCYVLGWVLGHILDRLGITHMFN